MFLGNDLLGSYIETIIRKSVPELWTFWEILRNTECNCLPICGLSI